METRYNLQKMLSRKFIARETASEFTINKIAESYNILFNKELLLSQGLYPATNMEISPLSLKID